MLLPLPIYSLLNLAAVSGAASLLYTIRMNRLLKEKANRPVKIFERRCLLHFGGFMYVVSRDFRDAGLFKEHPKLYNRQFAAYCGWWVFSILYIFCAVYFLD